MAVLFGQTEEEISKEYGSYKAKKLYAKLDYILPTYYLSYEDFKAKCLVVADYGFKSITVLPNYIGISKDLLKGKNVLVRALISYPYGEDFSNVKYYAVKQAIKLGADAIAVVLSARCIKNGNYKVITKSLKRIVKIAKNRPVSAIIDANCISSYEMEKITKIISKECKLYSIMPYFFKEDKSKYLDTVKGVITAVNGKCHVDFGGEVSEVLDVVNIFSAGANSITNSLNLEVANELNIKIISNV
jgi:deoxyribose-phosphate aldolase